MTIWLLAIGLVSILSQVVLLRELNVAFFGSELIYILAIGCWLLWTGTGALAGRGWGKPAERFAGGEVRLLLVILGLVLPATVVFVRGVRRLFGAVPGAYLPFPQQIAAMGLALLPVGLLLGLLFLWAARRYVESGRTLARAYALESLGGLAGGILASLFLKWGVQNFTAGLLGGLLSLAAACWPWRAGRGEGPGRPRWLVPAVAGTSCLVLAALARTTQIDRRLTAWNHPSLVETRDTPYSRITITETSGQISVFDNDALAFESQGTAAEEFVHLAALQHAAPESVLVLGGGVEGLVEQVLLHRPRVVRYVELNRALLDLLSRHVPEDIRASLAAPSVEVVIADPRRFLEAGGRRATARDARYDLILVGMPEPESGQANRFYTQEFFGQCAARLRPGGVLAFRLRAAENLWTPQLIRRTASIHRALGAVFSHVTVLPGVTNIVLARQAPLETDPQVLGRRLEERGIHARLITAPYIAYLYTNDRFREIAGLLAGAAAPANSDTHPVCYQYTMLIWLSKFMRVDALRRVSDLTAAEAVRSRGAWLVALGALGALLFVRRRLAWRRTALVGLAGFLGMVLETALVLEYQVKNGVLYQDLGLLLTAFMSGLALGSFAIGRLAQLPRRDLPRWLGAALLGAFMVTNAVVARQLDGGTVGGLLPSAGLLLLCGFLVAAIFAHASLYRDPDQSAIISPLYGADLLGGCLGSLAAALFLIPMAGLGGSVMLMAGLAAIGLLLV